VRLVVRSNTTNVPYCSPDPPDGAARPGSSTQELPNIGEPFNPYGMFNGIWVPESLLRCTAISASAILLYGRLAKYAGRDGRCFPSVETLALELGMTVRQVQRLLWQLCNAKFLRRNAQYRPNGSQTANAYVFLYHAALAPATVEQTEQPAPAPPVCRPVKLSGDKNVTGGG